MRSVTTSLQPSGGPFAFLTLDRLLTGSQIHLIYWSAWDCWRSAGLARSGRPLAGAGRGQPQGRAPEPAALIAGLLVLIALAHLGERFASSSRDLQISADLSALRARHEAGGAPHHG
jgi:hypothetical protein